MKRVLMVSPHFPPDTTAASHRVRLLAPHLADFGWEPTIVTVDPRDYEGRLDPGLAALVREDLRVVRVRAIPAKWTRLLRVGDLGIRSFPGILRACRALLKERQFDCFFVTVYPTYTALIGPIVKRFRPLPFVLDYQDPWVGSWGLITGPGPNESPDCKSRLSRKVALVLEPLAVRAADAITAVSAGTLDGVRERCPRAKNVRFAEIPLGGEPGDFEYLRARPRTNPFFNPGGERFQLSYVGTLLPAGLDTLRGFLQAVALLKSGNPELYRRLDVRFFGTSNQTTGELRARVLPEARSLGVEDAVFEEPARIDYLDALNVLVQSNAILLLGSSEKHYTASKLYPALLARRPILAAFHEESSVVSILRGAVTGSWCKLVTYDDRESPRKKSGALYRHLAELVASSTDEVPEPTQVPGVDEFSARTLAGRLAAVFDAVSGSQ